MQNKVQSFLNIVDTTERLNLIKNNLTKLSMEVSIEGDKLAVKRKGEITIGGEDVGLEFIQACLDKEFEVANPNQALLGQIADYMNGKGSDIDTIFMGIEFSEPKPFTPIDNRELTNTEVIADLVFKHGLVSMQDFVDFKVEDLALSNDVTKECPLPYGWQGQYNPNTMLENGQVSAMTYNLLKSEGLQAGRDYYLYQVNLANEWEAQRKEEQIKLALLSATQGKPVALQLANNSHWITLCLLPDKSDQSKINLVMMDGREKDQVGEIEVEGLSEEEKAMILATSDQHHLDPKEVVDKLKELGPKLGMNVSDLHDVSVKGQQHNNSCGLDTTLNTAAIIKTHRDYADKLQFNSEVLKEALDPNVYYQKKDDRYYICGQEAYLLQPELVTNIGNNLILRSFEEQNYKNGIQKPAGTIQDDLNRLVIEPILNKKFDSSNSQNNSYISTEEESDGENQKQHNEIVPVGDAQKSQFYTDLNTFLANDTNKKLMARYIREKSINFEENNLQLEGVSDDLKSKVNEVMQIARPDQDISLGVINGFIVWLANFVGWEKSNLFEIVNENTTAKSWAEKIKSEQPSNQLPEI